MPENHSNKSATVATANGESNGNLAAESAASSNGTASTNGSTTKPAPANPTTKRRRSINGGKPDTKAKSAASRRSTKSPGRGATAEQNETKVREAVRARGLTIAEKTKSGYLFFAEFEVCPFREHETDSRGKAHVGVRANGPLEAGCQSAGCAGANWGSLKTILGITSKPKPKPKPKPKRSRGKAKTEAKTEAKTASKTKAKTKSTDKLDPLSLRIAIKPTFGFNGKCIKCTGRPKKLRSPRRDTEAVLAQMHEFQKRTAGNRRRKLDGYTAKVFFPVYDERGLVMGGEMRFVNKAGEKEARPMSVFYRNTLKHSSAAEIGLAPHLHVCDPPRPWPLFTSREPSEIPEGSTVLVTEGPKAARIAEMFTSTPGASALFGCKSAHKSTYTHLARAGEVVLWADVGARSYMTEQVARYIARDCPGVAIRILPIDVAGCVADGDDIEQWMCEVLKLGATKFPPSYGKPDVDEPTAPQRQVLADAMAKLLDSAEVITPEPAPGSPCVITENMLNRVDFGDRSVKSPWADDSDTEDADRVPLTGAEPHDGKTLIERGDAYQPSLVYAETENGSRLRQCDGVLYRYDGTRYEAIEKVGSICNDIAEFVTEKIIFAKTSKESTTYATPPLGDAYLKDILAMLSNANAVAHSPSWIDEPDRDASGIMSAPSGLWHVGDGGELERIAHTPNFFTTWALPFSPDPDANEHPVFDKFCDETWDGSEDEKRLLLEWFGYVLAGDNRFQKIMLAIGPTGAGKGVCTRLLQEMVGTDNVCTPDIPGLSGRFLSELLGKRVALMNDIKLAGHDASIAVDRIKAISGGDRVNIDRKFKTALTGVSLDVRFYITTNDIPAVRDTSAALLRRLCILKFSKAPDKADLTLEPRMHKELPAIFNASLRAYHRLVEQGQFTEPATSLAAREDFRHGMAPLSEFVEDYCDLASDHKGEGFPDDYFQIRKSVFYDFYRAWCIVAGGIGDRTMANSAVVGKELLGGPFPGVTSYHKRSVNDGRLYVGIRLRDDAGQQLDDLANVGSKRLLLQRAGVIAEKQTLESLLDDQGF